MSGKMRDDDFTFIRLKRPAEASPAHETPGESPSWTGKCLLGLANSTSDASDDSDDSDGPTRCQNYYCTAVKLRDNPLYQHFQSVNDDHEESVS